MKRQHPGELTDKMRLLQFERGQDIRTIIRTCLEAGGSITGGADVLGLTAPALRVWIEDLGGRIVHSVIWDPEETP